MPYKMTAKEQMFML